MTDEELSRRMRAVSKGVDDADWNDVRRRAERLMHDRSGRRWLGRRGRARAAQALALCVAVVAVVTLVAEVLPSRRSPTSSGGLADVAAIAAAAPSTVPAAGQFAYSKRRYTLQGTGPDGDCTQEWWIAADASGRVRQHGDACSSLRGRRRVDIRFGPGEANRLYVMLAVPGLTIEPSKLPVDPDELEDALRDTLLGLADAPPEDDAAAQAEGMLQMVEQALANPLAEPRLRSSLYIVAGNLDGVRLQKDVTDPVGRPGSAITLEQQLRWQQQGEHMKHELIFDPRTSRSLASRTTWTIAAESYRVTHAHVFLEQARVSSLHERP